MRIYHDGDPIRVRADSDGQPIAFVWKGYTHRVDTIEDIREPKLDWWSMDGEVHRTYFVVTTNRGLIAEIYRDEVAGDWKLGRVYD